jgi:hypothetical protein
MTSANCHAYYHVLCNNPFPEHANARPGKRLTQRSAGAHSSTTKPEQTYHYDALIYAFSPSMA